jgi:hypothetical protein
MTVYSFGTGFEKSGQDQLKTNTNKIKEEPNHDTRKMEKAL